MSEIVQMISANNKKLAQKKYLEEGDFPVIDQGQDFVGGYSNDKNLVIEEEPPFIVFGDHTRAFKFANFQFVPGADGVKIMKPLGVDPKWCFYIFQAIKLPNKGYARHFQYLKEAYVPVPPPEQQKRIVAKIEEIFSHIDAGIEALKKAKQLLKQYRQSVLKAAVTGELTKEWREENKDNLEPASQLLERILKERRKKWEEQQLEQFNAKGKMPRDDKWKEKYKKIPLPDSRDLPSIPEEWEWVQLQHVFDVITDGDHQAPPKSETGIPFLVIGNVNKGVLDFSETRFVPRSYFDGLAEIRKPSNGDLLYTVVGSYGIPVKVNTDKEFCVQRHIAILKPSKNMNVGYLYWILYSGFVFKQAGEVATGTAQKTVSLGGLRGIFIPLPPKSEQKEIAKVIENKFSAMDRLSDESDKKITMAEKNKQSILMDAFSGKLVEALPGEEPASVLLKRIRVKKEGKTLAV